jgi:hypothetical protein
MIQQCSLAVSPHDLAQSDMVGCGPVRLLIRKFKMTSYLSAKFKENTLSCIRLNSSFASSSITNIM